MPRPDHLRPSRRYWNIFNIFFHLNKMFFFAMSWTKFLLAFHAEIIVFKLKERPNRTIHMFFNCLKTWVNKAITYFLSCKLLCIKLITKLLGLFEKEKNKMMFTVLFIIPWEKVDCCCFSLLALWTDYCSWWVECGGSQLGRGLWPECEQFYL